MKRFLALALVCVTSVSAQSSPDLWSDEAFSYCRGKAAVEEVRSCAADRLLKRKVPVPLGNLNYQVCTDLGTPDMVCADAGSEQQMRESAYVIATKRREAERAEDDARQLARESACAKAGNKYGVVRIGMGSAAVKRCGWGEPMEVNRTTTARGVSEQWVYPDHAYLYFENGRLTAIQD